MQTNTVAAKSEPTSDHSIVFGAMIDAELKISTRTRRDWIAKGILPPPDGDLMGRAFWRLETYQRFKSDVMANRFSRERLPRLRAASAA
jgi:hypothetical protein